MVNEYRHTTTDAGDATHMCHVKCISWTSILAGAIIGVGISFLLNLFAVAIGLSAFTSTKEGMATLAIGGAIGMIIIAIVSMYAAGFVAGFLGRPYCFNRNMGAVYGFLAWCLALFISILLATSVDDFISIQYDAIARTPHTSVRTATNRATDASYTMDNKSSSASSDRQEASRDRDRDNTKQMTPREEKATHAVGIALFVTFLLFFIGALAASFGGYFGLKCRETGCGDERGTRPRTM